MNIYITRHGQTDWNALLKIQGRSDVSLNENGRAQAKRSHDGLIKNGIRFDRVYSSPLKRAFETACIVSGFSSNDVIKDDRIIELSFGIAEGTTPEQRLTIDELKDFYKFFDDPVNYKAPKGAESFEQGLKRTADFWQNEIKPLYGRFNNILISTHGAALQALLLYVDGRSINDYWQVKFPNCSMNLVSYDGNEFKIEWNSRMFY